MSADPGAGALKRGDDAFDTERAMRIRQLKLQVQRADYVIDPPMVATAMIRHAVSQRRWWNPRTSRATPPASSTTSGGPSATSPIHVSGAANSAAARSRAATQTHNS